MSLLRGDDTRPVKKSDFNSAARRLFTAFAALTFACVSNASQRVPLTLAEAEDLALVAEPGQAALLARADAFEQRAAAAGELDNPQLRMGLANYPIESGGFSTEGMTQAQLGIRQVFPPGDSRAIGARRYESLAAAMDGEAGARGRDVLTAVRASWLDAYYWERAETIVSGSRSLFVDLVRVTESLYAVGTNERQDVLRAELELSRLDARLIEISERKARARARLAQWVGSDASRPVADKLPDWPMPPPIETLKAALPSHPVLGAADARIEAQAAGVELAEAEKKPGWALDLGYGYREGMLPSGEPRSDFVSLAVTVDLPVLRKNRQDSNLAAAIREQRAAVDTKNELMLKLTSELEAEYARWHDLDRRVALYEDRIVRQSSEQAEAALSAYRSETGDFAEVMRAAIDELDTRLETIRLKTERAQSNAVLANLGGLER